MAAALIMAEYHNLKKHILNLYVGERIYVRTDFACITSLWYFERIYVYFQKII